MDSLRIRLAKESFKFSATHFTVLNANEAERLHGHNYQVSVECTLSGVGPLGMGFEFNHLKPHIKQMTDAWDEMVLIPRVSPLIKISEEEIRKSPHWIVDLVSAKLNRSYRFPKSEVVFLETVNITSEELARLFAISLATAWRSDSNRDIELNSRVQTLSVSIEETRGQSATYVMQSPLNQSELR